MAGGKYGIKNGDNFMPQARAAFKHGKKAQMANGPLVCPSAMDGMYHKNIVIFLQSFGGLFCGILLVFQTFRQGSANRKGEYYKYVNIKELKDTMANYGIWPGAMAAEWQMENAAKAKAKFLKAADGGDDDDDE